jgi:hypothetical protein
MAYMFLLHGDPDELAKCSQFGEVRQNKRHAVLEGSVVPPKRLISHTLERPSETRAKAWLDAGKNRLAELREDHRLGYPWPEDKLQKAREDWVVASESLKELEETLDGLFAEYQAKKKALQEAIETAREALHSAAEEVVVTHGKELIPIEGSLYETSVGRDGKFVFLQPQHRRGVRAPYKSRSNVDGGDDA